MPSHIRMFLTTNIQDIGFLSAIGNFCLAPMRLFGQGKTIRAKGSAIAKVSSFNDALPIKRSKQDPELSTSGMNPTVFMLMLVLALPGLIIGSVFKALSFIDPRVRRAHLFVKEKLTPKDEFLGAADNPLSAELLEEQLRTALLSAQKIKSLVIYTADPLNEVCSELIKKVNPFNVILINEKTKGLAGLLSAGKIKENWEFHLTEEPMLDPKPWDNPIHSNAECAKAVFAAKSPGFFEKKHKVFVLTPSEATSVLGSPKQS